jgi:hypothetical protein
MKPQEKQGCLIGIGLLILWFVLFFLSIEFDAPILKGLSFGIPGFAISFIYGKYFGVKEFQWKAKRDLPLILLGIILLVFFTWMAYSRLW